MTLEGFMQGFLARPMSEIRTIEHRNSGHRTSTILAREGNFQCELIIWGPNLLLPAHRHPNMRGIARHIDGDTTFVVGDGKTEEQTNDLIARAGIWKAKFYQNRLIRVEPDTWHGGKAGIGGASFFIFSQWQKFPTAAGIDWEGPPLPKAMLSRICV